MFIRGFATKLICWNEFKLFGRFFPFFLRWSHFLIIIHIVAILWSWSPAILRNIIAHSFQRGSLVENLINGIIGFGKHDHQAQLFVFLNRLRFIENYFVIGVTFLSFWIFLFWCWALAIWGIFPILDLLDLLQQYFIAGVYLNLAVSSDAVYFVFWKNETWGFGFLQSHRWFYGFQFFLMEVKALT